MTTRVEYIFLTIRNALAGTDKGQTHDQIHQLAVVVTVLEYF